MAAPRRDPAAPPLRGHGVPAGEALSRARGLAPRTAPEWVALDDLAGRVLARPVVARRDLPAADSSAMDGWAVRASDGAGPRRVAGESAAGHAAACPLRPGEASRISTGALLPPGADAVLRREDGREVGGRLVADRALRPWADVRRRGDDLLQGAELLAAGTRVAAHEAAVVAAAGHAGAFCRRRPRVAFCTTGDELVAPGATPPRDGVVESNLAGLAAQARAAGAVPCASAHAADARRAATDALAGLLEAGPDLLVTVGGISVGVHDHVGPALEELGARWELRGVAMRPGHPVGIAARAATVVLALPGNPAAAAVCFHLLGRALLGAGDDWERTAPLAAPVARHPRDATFLRCAWEGDTLRPLGRQGPAQLTSLAGARALAWIAPGEGELAPGDRPPVSAMP